MKIIYGVCSWGLGHATRSLPIMRKMINENHELTIISDGRSLDLLKKELGEQIEYIQIPDYPMILSKDTKEFIAKTLIYWPVFIRKMQSGLNKLTKMLQHRKCDIIVSDGRYDIYSRKIPSFFISHQMRIMNPLRIKMLENGSEIYNLFFFKRFCGILIPDYKNNDLSGNLSHNLKRIDEKKLHYIGLLSDFKKKNVKKDVDYLVSISGPEPQRTILEKKILSQIDKLDGKIVMTLGKTEEDTVLKNDNIETYSFLSREKRESFLNRSKVVISRSGYSTIMDIAIVGNKALMIPTPGQVEQEYLASYHKKRNTFFSMSQRDFDLSDEVLQRVSETTGFQHSCDVDKSVEHVFDVVFSVKKSPFA